MINLAKKNQRSVSFSFYNNKTKDRNVIVILANEYETKHDPLCSDL